MKLRAGVAMRENHVKRTAKDFGPGGCIALHRVASLFQKRRGAKLGGAQNDPNWLTFDGCKCAFTPDLWALRFGEQESFR
jgi:hypothetical protein